MKLTLKLAAWGAVGAASWWTARKLREAMDFYLWERELAVAQETCPR